VLKGAVIGCGRGGHIFLEAWRRVCTASIQAVADLDAGAAAAAARTCSVPRSYSDVDVLLAREKPDFVHLAVGVDAQPTVVRKCLAAGVSVLAAPPLATHLDEARQLADMARGRGLHLMVGCRERWRSAFRALRSAAAATPPGTLHYARIFDRRPLARSRPADPARPALDRLQHLLVLEGLLGCLDLVRFMFGEVASVWGATLHLNPAVRGEDFALAVLRTDGPAPVNVVLDVNWSAPLPGRAGAPALLPEVRLEGAGGALELDPQAGLLRVRGHGGAPRETPLPAVSDFRLEPLIELQGHFAESIEGGRRPECSADDALLSLEAALAVYESARTGALVLIRKP
jgi:predicted dehydrogenase